MLAIQSGGVNWVHQDPVTKSQLITNSAGTVVSTIDLDPWGGDTLRSSNEAFQPHRFTSYERDGDGADDAMHRRYNRWWHRFNQPDPYDGSYSLTDPQSFNRYAYVHNDPVNFVDPSGLNEYGPPTGGYGSDGCFAVVMDGFLIGYIGNCGGGGGFGSGGGSYSQEPAKPSHSKDDRNDCERFAEDLVNRLQVTADAQSLGQTLTRDGLNDSQAGYGKEKAVTGFKKNLTSGGQNGDVYRHVMFVAGAQLLMRGELTTGDFGENIARSMFRIIGGLSDNVRAYDWAQSKWSGPESERGAEHRGNQAGLQVGDSMLDTYGRARSHDAMSALRDALTKILCGE